MVRVCPHCDVRLDNVRCQRCFSLQPPGAFACARCASSLELEPLLYATDAPCPRCRGPLDVAPGDDSRLHECPRCGGMFVPREALAEILCGAEVGGALREGAPRRPSHPGGGSAELVGKALGDVRYVPCPLCHATMNRVNFGKVSGVIVDVCKRHGTWFDAGELTRVVAFAASGGLERTRAREKQDTHDAKGLRPEVREQFAAMQVHEPRQRRTAVWREFLSALFDV
jgi:Zn-finger nucleic acid-binding protein